MKNNSSLGKIYEIRDKFVLLGLTGRTGAGCSTVAKVLKTKKFNELTLSSKKNIDYHNAEDRKYRIINKFMEKHWESFHVIEVSSIILFFVFNDGVDNFVEFLNNPHNADTEKIDISDKEELITKIEKNFKPIFNAVRQFTQNDESTEPKSCKECIDFYYKKLIDYKNEFRSVLKKYTCSITWSSKLYDNTSQEVDLYTFLMQIFGNNIRRYGNPYKDNSTEVTPYVIADKIDEIIANTIKYHKEYCGDKKVRICIDALRNPLEVIYFREKYRAFQLVAINTEESMRKKRLSNLTDEKLKNIDNIEYPAKISTEMIFYHQNIQNCLEIADIYIYNPTDSDYRNLTKQIMKYISLILHPGLVTPTNVERCMQLAYNVRYNSGCLSRQVGAVITDSSYSIKAVGWNDVPHGQVPCNLRDISEYCKDKNVEEYSNFELNDVKFSNVMKRINETISEYREKKDIIDDLIFPYCFKDIYNAIEGKNNQVHTRALHAEENAFLQISKYGGVGIKGGCLFTTASPCELCSKKAYQLGITKIYYIDP